MAEDHEDGGADPTPAVSRRSFVVMMGAALLGRFSLPQPPAAAASVPAGPVAETAGEPIRRLMLAPVWSDSRQIMVWMEEPKTDDGDPVLMCWYPLSDEERAEAERFFATVTWRSWTTPEDLRELLGPPGPWIIRWNRMGDFQFLTTAEPKRLFGPDADDDKFTDDPAGAAPVTSGQALRLILRLTDEWGLTDCDSYLEPVRPSDATTDFRATCGA